MTLSVGARLGPYEILAPIGAGGMGEVYRARDGRLDRDVAVKVLPSHLADDPVALARFEREAKAVAALSHPGILAIFDVGSAEGLAYAVTELLEGETLRTRLAEGPLPLRTTIAYAIQMAEGLGAAHEKGIVHRDLKPENLFLTKDDRVKILDFGLARQTVPPANDTSSPTLSRHTDPGTVLGTVGYMSPEQVRGQPAGPTSDIFSFGAVLYEMLTARRAFKGDSAAETMHAILKEDPPDLLDTNRSLPLALERIVRHCLEKRAEQRFHSALDLAFDLKSLSGLSEPSRAAAPTSAAPPRWRWLRPGAAGLIVLAAGALGLGVGKALWQRPLPIFTQLTFRRGTVLSAFFTSDGQTVVYSATWDGLPPEIFSVRVESQESRSLGLPPALLLGVSSQGELAILLTPAGDTSASSKGVLARVPLSGGVPRRLLEDVRAADWSPDGHDLAVVRDVGGQAQLEYPIGTVLKRPVYSYAFWHVRVAPHGDRVAFCGAASGGYKVSIFDRAGHETPVQLPSFVWGIAWSPQGDAIWANAGESLMSQGFWRVTLDGKAREVFRTAGDLALHDVSRDGRILFHTGWGRVGVQAKPPGGPGELDVGVFDWSALSDLTPDGTQLLLTVGLSPSVSSVFLRSTRDGPPVRLGEGVGFALSPDGKWALIVPGDFSKHPRLTLTPTGPGEPRELPLGHLERPEGGWFAAPGRVVLNAAEPGRPIRTFVMDLSGGEPRAVTPEGVSAALYSDRDGLIGSAADGTLARYPLTGGDPKPISTRLPLGTTPISVSRDGRSLLIYENGPVPVHVERLDLTTGRRTLWKVLRPDDATGVNFMYAVIITPDEQSYAYTYGRFLQHLYVVEGLK